MPDLRFAPCQITQEIPDGVDSLEQGCAPMMVGDHTPQLLPEALLRIQLGRGGEAESQSVRQLSRALPANLHAKAGRDEVTDQLRGPQAHVIAHRTRAVADGLLELGQLFRRESRRSPRNWCTLQASEPGRIERMAPAAHGLLVSIQPLGDLGAAFAIHQPQDAVVTLTPAHIRRMTKGTPQFLAA
jgi:hypothetical protein